MYRKEYSLMKVFLILGRTAPVTAQEPGISLTVNMLEVVAFQNSFPERFSISQYFSAITRMSCLLPTLNLVIMVA